MGIAPANAPTMSPEARVARGLNLLMAGLLLALCVVALVAVLTPIASNPSDYGESRGMGLVVFVFGLPFPGLFWLAAEGFRRHARWRWIAQLAAVSPVVLIVLQRLVRWLR